MNYDLQTAIPNFLTFLEKIIPFLLGIAFVVFLWNVFRYFILNGSSDEGQTKAKSFMLWSIIGFVIIISFWGIVNILVSGLGLDNRAIVPDYVCKKGNWGCQTGPSGSSGIPTNGTGQYQGDINIGNQGTI